MAASPGRRLAPGSPNLCWPPTARRVSLHGQFRQTGQAWERSHEHWLECHCCLRAKLVELELDRLAFQALFSLRLLKPVQPPSSWLGVQHYPKVINGILEHEMSQVGL